MTFPLQPGAFSVFLTFRAVSQIDVQIQSGRLITITVSPDDTLDDVREKIEMKEGISPDQQVLMLNGIKLMDGNVEELGIIESATLFLTLRNWGG